MAVFFGKFSDKFPDQINNGYYRTNRPEMFGDLQLQDIVFAIGGGKIQLWKALNYKNVEDDKQMDFEIIHNDLQISISEFILLKFFKINIDLSIYPYRQSQKAFFQINLVDNTDELIFLDKALYGIDSNYRNIHFIERIVEINKELIDKDIFIYKDTTHWNLFDSPFIDNSLKNNFRDNIDSIGKGRIKKDKILKEIRDLELPRKFKPNEFSFLNLYDTFLCEYAPKDVTNEIIETLNIYPYKIFKLSQGKDFSIEEHNLLLGNGLVSVHKDTKAKATSSITQGESFINAKIGDYFYLCKGNDFIELIGQFTSAARPSDEDLFGDESWYVRDYKVIAQCNHKIKYKGVSKWWTPKDNSTFIEIPNREFSLANEYLFNPFFLLSIISSKSEYQMNQVVKLLETKKQIILQGAPGTGKTYTTAELALRIIGVDGVDFLDRKEVMTAYQKAVKEEQIVFTTFHQSLDYEEFIEGIKPISDEDGISYAVLPGIFKKLCKKASQDEGTNNLENAIEDFKERCSETEDGIELKTKEGVSFSVKYNGGITFKVRSSRSLATVGKSFPASIENIIKLHNGITKGMYNKSYVWGILNYLKNEYNITADLPIRPSKKNYVLIIDEINRGNISKIFGELISLLEADKRLGAANEINCRLPYTPDEEFGVPDNLYIIGTMNTTDRSLGHVDYAVRRRFGFVTLESDVNKVNEFYSTDNDLKQRAVTLFNSIYKLIHENTSNEFQSKDIMVGHSYFMAKDENELKMKLEYEIKPLLREYTKDGLLTLNMEDIKIKIDTLSV